MVDAPRKDLAPAGTTANGVGLLGPLLIAEAEPSPAIGAKAKAVFAYLAAHTDAAVSRDELAELCWERSGAEQARQSLRQALSQLRRNLPPNVAERLAATSEQVRLVGVDVDAAAFEAATASGEPARWVEALALWRGPLLGGLEAGSPGFDDWVARERLRFETLRADLLARLAEHRLGVGEHALAIEAARRLVAADPLREDGHRLLLRTLVAAGRRAEALAQYDELERLLRSELAVAPDPATRALVEGLREAPMARKRLPADGAAAAQRAAPVFAFAPAVVATLPRRWRWAAAIAGLAGLTAAGAIAAWRTLQPPSAADAPVLVVRPFEPLSPEPETAAIARALATRMSGGLSSVPTVRVRSPDSRGREPELRVEGTVQAADGGAQVTARLVSGSGEVLRQAEFKAPPRTPLEMQDEILGRVGRLITERLDEVAYPRGVASAQERPALDIAYTARNMVNRGDTSDKVLELFRDALRLDADNVEIKGLFANALVAQALNSALPIDRQRDILAEALRMFAEVEAGAPHLQVMLYGRCQALRALYDLQAARSACARAQAAMPWSARVYKEWGYTMLYLGMLDQADAYFQAAERLERQGTIRWTWAVGAGITALLRDQPETAARWLRIATAQRPRYRWFHLYEAVAARRLGDEDAVRGHIALFRQLPKTIALEDYFESVFSSRIDYPAEMQAMLTRLKRDMASLAD